MLNTFLDYLEVFVYPQNGAVVAVDLVGLFPEVLGWLWYSVISFLSIFALSIIISLNVLRICLIFQVVFLDILLL